MQNKTNSPSKDNYLKITCKSTLTLLASDLEKKESLFVRQRNIFIQSSFYNYYDGQGLWHGSRMKKYRITESWRSKFLFPHHEQKLARYSFLITCSYTIKSVTRKYDIFVKSSEGLKESSLLLGGYECFTKSYLHRGNI